MATFRRDPFEYLTGRLDDNAMPPGISAPGRPGKFSQSGKARRFPGNTIICHLDPESRAFGALVNIQKALRGGRYAGHFTFLPPESFHMTVFSGVTGPEFDKTIWPEGVASHCPLRKVSRTMLDRIDARPDWPQRLFVSARELHGGYSITLEGRTDANETLLRLTRDRLADAIGMQRPDHHRYTFHFSLAYLVAWLSDAEARDVINFSASLFEKYAMDLHEIELGPMEFCEFETMHHFECLQTIGNHQSKLTEGLQL